MSRKVIEGLAQAANLKGSVWHYMDPETVAGYGPWVRYEDHATALAETQATVARQQVMLDRAEAEIARLEDVLEIVAAGPIRGEPMARWINHMMAKARAALARPHATKGDD